MGRGKGRRRHIYGIPKEGPLPPANEKSFSIGEYNYDNIFNQDFSRLAQLLLI